jgi:hypothetical protein
VDLEQRFEQLENKTRRLQMAVVVLAAALGRRPGLVAAGADPEVTIAAGIKHI